MVAHGVPIMAMELIESGTVAYQENPRSSDSSNCSQVQLDDGDWETISGLSQLVLSQDRREPHCRAGGEIESLVSSNLRSDRPLEEEKEKPKLSCLDR